MADTTFNVLSLCTGIGGLDIGLKLVVPAARSVCYVEGEAFAVAVLGSRMRDGYMDEAPLWSNVRNFDGKPWRRVVDCVTAGFPCQPVSRAGRRQGEDHHHWLWHDITRITDECEPGFVFIENVDALRANGGRRVCDDLAARGYAVAWDIFSARASGASHSRPRLFILAAKWQRMDNPLLGRRGSEKEPLLSRWCANFPSSPRVLSDSPRIRSCWPEPGLQRRPDGTSDWVDRLRAAGNAVVPKVAAVAWIVLLERLRKLIERS